MKIVEYDRSYAKAIARMWQNSKEEWSGMTFATTEESVIKDAENYPGKKIILAVEDDAVVGYLSFSEETGDYQGIVYLRILNVLTSCRGQGIGGKLLEEVMNRAAKDGKKSLWLHTWAGNDKGVPRYKRSGFFYKRTDDYASFFNMLPHLLSSTLTKEYIADYDLMKDRIANFDREKDGYDENGFAFYEYRWEKDGSCFVAIYDQEGLGLKYLETDDFIISLGYNHAQPVLGQQYEAEICVTSKTKEELSVSIEGIKDRFLDTIINIENEAVIDKKSFTACLNIDEPETDFKVDLRRCLKYRISINGKDIIMGIGVAPVFPLEASFEGYKNMLFAEGRRERIFLNLKNHLSSESTFKINLPEIDGISFIDKSFNISLKPEQQKAIPIEIILSKPIVHLCALEVGCEVEGRQHSFIRNLELVLATGKGFAMRKFEKSYQAILGKSAMTYYYNSSYNNYISLLDIAGESFISLSVPELNYPGAVEINTIKPSDIELYQENGDLIIKSKIVHQEPSGVTVKPLFRLSPQGVINMTVEVENTGNSAYKTKLHTKRYLLANNWVACTGDKIIKLNHPMPVHQDQSYLLPKSVDENWIMKDMGNNAKESLVWDSSWKASRSEGALYLETEEFEIKQGEVKTIGNVEVLLNVFQNWQSLRKYANGKESRFSPVQKALDIGIEGGNPFYRGAADVKLLNNIDLEIKGKLELLADGEPIENGLVFSDKPTLLELKCVPLSIDIEKSSLIYPISDDVVKTETKGNMASCSNGVISFEYENDYAPALISLSYKGQNYLDSMYPNYGNRSWWSPFIGGLLCFSPYWEREVFVRQQREFQFAEKKDNYGNLWSGLKITIKTDDSQLSKEKKVDGLTVEQYFMMLPGVPILLTQAVVDSKIETLRNIYGANSSAHFNLSLKDTIAETYESDGTKIVLHSSKGGCQASVDKALRIIEEYSGRGLYAISSKRDAQYVAIGEESGIVIFNQNNVEIKPGQKEILEPISYFFTDKDYSPDAFDMLKNVYLVDL